MREWSLELHHVLQNAHSDAEALDRIDAIYDKRGYRADFGFEEPTKKDRRLNEVARFGGAKVLHVNGVSTAWAYIERNDKSFWCYYENREIKTDSLERAHKLAVLICDLEDGPFDRALGVDREIWPGESGRVMMDYYFTVTHNIEDVYAVVGHRESSPYWGQSGDPDAIYEKASLRAGDHVYALPRGFFAIPRGANVRYEVRFDEPSDADMSTEADERQETRAFPMSRLYEGECGPMARQRFTSALEARQRCFGNEHARVGGRGGLLIDMAEREVNLSHNL